MHLTRRIDRAFQWAGEKMGGDKTAHSDEFNNLETEMNLRHEGMEKLQKSTNGYIKWISRRGESLEDKEKAVPIGYVGRMMVSHGEDFEPESEFGTNMIALGRAHERIADIQGSYATDVTDHWLDSIDRSLAMMKEYQSARKKHESRRLAYDASISKQQKARREDYRIEEEMRANRAKFEESGEDVMRRMQDIKEAEADNLREMSGFLDAELDYHERCAEELRRVRQAWTAIPAAAAGPPSPSSPLPVERSHTRRASESRPTVRSRTNTLRSFNDYSPRDSVVAEQPEPAPEPREATPPPQPTRAPFRTQRSESRVSFTTMESPSRPVATRANTIQSSPVYRPSSVAPAAVPLPVAGARRAHTTHAPSRADTVKVSGTGEDIFADDYDDSSAGAGSRSGSPGWAERSASPATSFGSANSSTSNLARRAPPPPPPCRSKKPPPVPPKRVVEVGY